MKMNKSKPIRTCIACRQEFEKNQLLRIVRTPEGNYIVDKTGKANGRGAYICNSVECAKKLKKNRLLNRAFGTAISEETYQAVEEALVGKQE
ncbi:MAG: YlxR family protein [Clostridia bacterium]|nr:YlxR family protein [Clostridia bacterium]